MQVTHSSMDTLKVSKPVFSRSHEGIKAGNRGTASPPRSPTADPTRKKPRTAALGAAARHPRLTAVSRQPSTAQAPKERLPRPTAPSGARPEPEGTGLHRCHRPARPGPTPYFLVSLLKSPKAAGAEGIVVGAASWPSSGAASPPCSP